MEKKLEGVQGVRIRKKKRKKDKRLQTNRKRKIERQNTETYPKTDGSS